MLEAGGDETWPGETPPPRSARKALAPAGRMAAFNAPAPSPAMPASASDSAAPIASAEREPTAHLWIILSYFAISFGSQLLLLIPQFAPLRIELRILPFGISLLLAMFPPIARGKPLRMHPALPFAVSVMCIIAFGLFHQETDSLLGGVAQIALYAAILSPILWAGRLKVGIRSFVIVLTCLWGFNAMSAGVGVLQIVFPGHFQPATSTVIQEMQELGYENNIELADGTQTTRPFGLTDSPGGASAAGLIAFVFGLGLLISTKNNALRAMFLTGMGVGLFVMYLSQVRSLVVMCGVATVVFVGLMSVRGEVGRLSGALVALAVVITISTAAAFTIGGSQTRDRLFTLVDDDAGSVYRSNRGMFLDYTFNYALPMFPFGAGLGRYGMMAHYFAKNGDRAATSLWAEIQWTSWVYDGGYPMVLAYPLGILAALWTTFQIGRDRKYGPVGLWAAIMTSYNVAVIAVTFSYPFFLSQSGLEFWLLNTCVYVSAQVYLRSLDVEVPEGFEVLPTPWKPKIDGGSGSSPVDAPPRREPLKRPRLPAVIPVFDTDSSKGSV